MDEKDSGYSSDEKNKPQEKVRPDILYPDIPYWGLVSPLFLLCRNGLNSTWNINNTQNEALIIPTSMKYFSLNVTISNVQIQFQGILKKQS